MIGADLDSKVREDPLEISSNSKLKPMQESNSEFSHRKHEKQRLMLPTNDILEIYNYP